MNSQKRIPIKNEGVEENGKKIFKEKTFTINFHRELLKDNGCPEKTIPIHPSVKLKNPLGPEKS